MFVVLFSFSESLATKCSSLIEEPYMFKSPLIDLYPIELNYYPFMISLDKCNGSCNILSPKIRVPRKTKDLSVKLFNMITNKNEA